MVKSLQVESHYECRFLVCGGRDYSDYEYLTNKLNKFVESILKIKGLETDFILIHGGCTGADIMSGFWAETHKEIRVLVFNADWKTFGKKAGFVRNKQMIEEGDPEFVIAFGGGKGTQNMIDMARNSQIKVLAI